MEGFFENIYFHVVCQKDSSLLYLFVKHTHTRLYFCVIIVNWMAWLHCGIYRMFCPLSETTLSQSEHTHTDLNKPHSFRRLLLHYFGCQAPPPTTTSIYFIIRRLSCRNLPTLGVNKDITFWGLERLHNPRVGVILSLLS